MKRFLTAVMLSAIACSAYAAPKLSAQEKGYVAQLKKTLTASQCTPLMNDVRVFSSKSMEYGTISMVVLPAEGCGGGNNWATYFQVFYNDGKNKTDYEAVPVVDNVIIRENVFKLEATTHGEDDPRCCPSQHESWFFKLEDGKLTPFKPKNK